MNLHDIGEQVGSLLGSKSKEESPQEEKEEGLSNEETKEQEGKEQGAGEEEDVSWEEDKETEETEGDSEEASEKGEEDKGDEETEDEGEVDSEKTPQEVQMEALLKQNELLRQQLNEVSGRGTEPDEIEEDKAPTLVLEDEFIGKDDDLEELFNDASKINATLNKTASVAANKALEHVYKSLPPVITRLVQDEVATYRQADQFFVENQDLLPQREFVSYVYNEMVKKDPETPPLTHFTNLAKEVRRRLGTGETLPNQNKGDKKKKRRGNFNPGSGKRAPQPKEPTGVGAEIKQLMDSR